MRFIRKYLVLSLLLSNISAIFVEDAAATERKRNVPPLTERIYKEISEAQLLIDPEVTPVDEGGKRPDIEANPRQAIANLEKLLNRRGINSYERAHIYSTLAFAWYTLDDIPKTIESYESVLQETITEALELRALRALFQLHYSEHRYQETLGYIDRWQALKETPDPDVQYLKATVFYQLDDYQNALETALRVEQIANEQERTIKEPWWYLQVVLYHERKQFEDAIPVLEKLIEHYPAKRYWMTIAGMYAETDQADKALAAWYVAWRQNMFDKEPEIVMLAQRFLNAEVPFEAAKVLEQGFSTGYVEENDKNVKLLAIAYTMAQEMDKAIDAWRAAARHAVDGQAHYRLAQALSRQDRHQEAVAAYHDALNEGGLNDVHDAYFWLGISLIQLEQWDEAIRAFREAARDNSKRESARQYIRYINGEKRREEALEKMLLPAPDL